MMDRPNPPSTYPVLEDDVTFDNVLELLGPMGRLRWTQICLSIVGLILVTFTPLTFLFLGYEPPHICNKINESQFISSHGYINQSDVIFAYQSCDIHIISNNQNGSHHDVATMPCPNGRNFLEERHTTFMSEWDLVCEAKGQAEISYTVFIAGQVVGGLVASSLADRYGRKPLFLVTAFFTFLFEAVTTFSMNIYMVSVLRFFGGMFRQGFCEIYFVHSIEFLLPGQRNLYGNVVCFFEVVYRLILGGIAYTLKDSSWRYIQGTVAAFGVFSIVYPLFISESPRWQVANNRCEDALDILRKACKKNNVEFSHVKTVFDKHLKHVDGQCQTESFLSLLRHRNTRYITLVTCYCWFSQNMVYYGLFMMSSELFGNRFINYCLMVLVEFPSTPLNYFMLERIGRRTVMNIFLALATLCLVLSSILCLFHYEHSGIAFTILFILGKFFMTSSYNVLFIWTPEIFPTNLRATGGALATCVGRISLLSVAYLRPFFTIVAWGPGTIFSVLGFINLLLTNCLPETKDQPLPDSIEEMANNGNISKKDDNIKHLLNNKVHPPAYNTIPLD